MTKNFVSISAVSDLEQLRRIAQVSKEERFSFLLAIGYQVSNKSINQGKQNPRQPKFSELGELDKATRDYGLITAIHYYTKERSTILNDLERVVDSGVEPSLLQFNTLPPSLFTLEKVKDMAFRPILKAAISDKQTPTGGYAVWKGDGVQDVSSGKVEPLIAQVDARRGLIDYVMFDPSHGTNLDLNLDEESLAVRFGKEIVRDSSLNKLGLVYAGGVKPTNVNQLTQVLEAYFPNRVSIDIESGVRTEDKLDFDMIREYLKGYQEARTDQTIYP